MADTDALSEIVRIATMAADMEAMKPRPTSAVLSLDGQPQGETEAERTRRLVNCAIRHSVDVGILVVPDDIDERLAQPIRLDWVGDGPPYYYRFSAEGVVADGTREVITGRRPIYGTGTVGP